MSNLEYPLRVKQTLTVTGTTSTITPTGTAVSGFQLLTDAGLTLGDYFRYTIEDGANYEIGNAYWYGSSFARYVIKSSNSNNRIDLSGNAVLFVTTTNFEVSPKQLLYEGSVSSGDTSVSKNFYDLGFFSGYNYRMFELELDRLTPVNDGQIYLRVLNSSGNAVNSSIYQGQYLEASSSTDYANRTTTSIHYLDRYSNCGGASGESGWSGSVFFHHRHNVASYYADQYPIIRSIGGYINGSNDPVTHQAFTNYLSYSDMYGFYLFVSSSGTFESGTYKLYGVF